MSLKRISAILAALAGSVIFASAAVVELKDDASVTGKILAEKPDSVVVDVGYTVLVIPQDQIIKIIRNAKTDPATAVKPDALAKSETPADIYFMGAKDTPMQDVRDLVNALGEAVVQVRTPAALGSGFIIDRDGYLITNFHVIEGETQISVEVYEQKPDGLSRRTYKQVRIVAIDKFADLALLQIMDKDAPKFAHVSLGDSEALAVGEHLFAIGSPLGLERTVTEGILSTKTREFEGILYLQTTAQINPGNSGGPLFDLGGNVVGVTNMKITFGEGLGFAIPVTAVKYFLDHRDAFAYSNDNPSNPYRYLAPPSRTQQTNIDDDDTQ
jgi:serine protease Do